ncbi:cytochrome P450 [Aspergillus aculeatinus CBS 121060]|uniref:Benzoate 4-monooxygenase cytochrome P450 n=1 Tax=Aspergillus aculeatinus CBS 121060 TaxID=1448322 RepID=A0ACD1HQA5_9EURO|nr:benzoate 4-monooxygenase cytochrome P450 [Aspergillus aculeatinus CBS 121060]RAH75643.1 benzoate 4-monooxygenase cytochrome P450 [Aspergillus aculeatinus CBS 121060]
MIMSPLLGLIFCFLGQWLLLRTIYRLYLHPLKKIPGPKLAAISHLYEFYYDIIKGGQFIYEIQRMHNQYGPIVRINPREVHVIDPEFYDEIYASGSRKRDKDARFVPTFTLPTSMIATVGHDHHRFRRGILANYFSRRSALELVPLVEERVLKLMDRLDGFRQSQRVVRLDDAFAGFAADVITLHSYGQRFGFLEDKNFRCNIRQAVGEITVLSHYNRFFPRVVQVIEQLPLWLLSWLQPGKSSLYDLQRTVYAQSQESIAKRASGSELRRSVFTSLTDPKVPPHERTPQRLKYEGFLVLAAGTETTGRVLTIAAFHLAHSPEICDRLRDELKQVMPTPQSAVGFPELEKLAYLTAVINEALRLASPLTIRLPRTAPDETLKYKHHVIPPGTPMSSSSYLMHRNVTIFPDPERFDPERWLDGSEQDRRLTRYLSPFTRGSRMCLGINLAYVELYLAIAHLVRRFDWELHETTPEDVRIVSDFILGGTRRGDIKVDAKIVGCVQD